MKRITVLLLACCLLLVACGSAAPKETPTPVSPALTAELNRLRDGVQPGTAGSALKAAAVAADLLDWAAEPVPQESIDATVREWLAGQSDEALERLPEQLEALRYTLEQLTAGYENAAGLLSDAGLEERGPWSAEAAERVAALLEQIGE